MNIQSWEAPIVKQALEEIQAMLWCNSKEISDKGISEMVTYVSNWLNELDELEWSCEDIGSIKKNYRKKKDKK